MSKEKILKKIGSIGDKYNISVWAVGGYVRDKILNKYGKDIDFVVLGDGPDFAKKVSEKVPYFDPDQNNVVLQPATLIQPQVNFWDPFTKQPERERLSSMI